MVSLSDVQVYEIVSPAQYSDSQPSISMVAIESVMVLDGEIIFSYVLTL